MARMARLKAADAIYHIMCKSISDAFFSLGIYIDKRRDHFNIIDYGFVMG
ncbi:hypothetical protein [Clostridium sp.]